MVVKLHINSQYVKYYATALTKEKQCRFIDNSPVIVTASLK